MFWYTSAESNLLWCSVCVCVWLMTVANHGASQGWLDCLFLLFHGATDGRFLLFTVGDNIPDRCKAGDVDVPIVALAASEQLVGAMETVQDPKDAIVLVEPAQKKGYKNESQQASFPIVNLLMGVVQYDIPSIYLSSITYNWPENRSSKTRS